MNRRTARNNSGPIQHVPRPRIISRYFIKALVAALAASGAVLATPGSALAADCGTRNGLRLDMRTSLMDSAGAGTAYIVSGYRLDYASEADGTTSYPFGNMNLYKVLYSYYGYDYYRGFYWNSSTGRWFQGSRGAQYITDGSAAPYALLTNIAFGTSELPASYYSYANCVTIGPV